MVATPGISKMVPKETLAMDDTKNLEPLRDKGILAMDDTKNLAPMRPNNQQVLPMDDKSVI